VEFEAFRPELNAALAYSNGTQGGRPPFDPVMMFKILVIQTTNNLSDERAEFRINDRLSFMRFLGGETHEGRRHRAIVRALRCDASAIRVHRHGGPDRRCEPDRRASSAQHPGREEGEQGRAHPRRLERQAREAARRIARRAGQANTPRPSRARMARCRPSMWRFRSSRSEPHLARSRFRLHSQMEPQMERDGRRRL